MQCNIDMNLHRNDIAIPHTVGDIWTGNGLCSLRACVSYTSSSWVAVLYPASLISRQKTQLRPEDQVLHYNLCNLYSHISQTPVLASSRHSTSFAGNPYPYHPGAHKIHMEMLIAYGEQIVTLLTWSNPTANLYRPLSVQVFGFVDGAPAVLHSSVPACNVQWGAFVVRWSQVGYLGKAPLPHQSRDP